MVTILRPFEYLEPGTVDEAVRILSRYGAKAKVLAGGLDLIIRMRKREIEPECVVSLQKISGLNYIEGEAGQGLNIGALTTLRSIELSLMIQQDYMPLYEAVHNIASIQVKNMGTVLGNICVATPASDVAPALEVFGAELKVTSPDSERTIPVGNLCIGVNQITIRPDEIVTQIIVPRVPAGAGGAFLKLSRTADDIAKINVAVLLTMKNKTCKEAKIALGAVAPTVIRAKKAEALLMGQQPTSQLIERVAEAAAAEVKPITDVRSTAEYRKAMTKVLVRRAIVKALDRAQG